VVEVHSVSVTEYLTPHVIVYDSVEITNKSEFPTLQNLDWSAKGDNPNRKSSVLQVSWGWAWG